MRVVRLRAQISRSPAGLCGFRGAFGQGAHGAGLCGRFLLASTGFPRKSVSTRLNRTPLSRH